MKPELKRVHKYPLAYSEGSVKKAWKFLTHYFVEEKCYRCRSNSFWTLVIQIVLDGITGCTWLAIKQWKLWFIFNRKAASKLRRGDGAQKAGLRFHRSANARWLRSEVTRSTLQLAQTSLLLRSTQQRSLPRLKRKQSKAETYEHSPTLLLFTALKFYLL